MGKSTTASKTTFVRRVERSQALEAYKHGDFRRAFSLGSELLRGAKRDLGLLELVGLSAVQIGHAERAVDLLMKAIRHDPRKPALLVGLAVAHAQRGDLDHALDAYERVLSLVPHDRAATVGKAMILERRGPRDEAADLLRPLIESGSEDADAAVVWATVEQSAGRHRESLDIVMKHLASPQTHLEARRSLCRLAAQGYGAIKEYDRAFEAFRASNAVIGRSFDPAAYVALIDELIETFSPQNLAMLPRAGDRSERPLFIACMPRSGSTLVEQIIQAHPDAFGAGEMTGMEELVCSLPQHLGSINPYPACLGDWTQEHADDCARSYAGALEAMSRRAARVVNKHLDNDLHLGFISLVCPGAKVVHCRRDPMDNGLSIYMAAMNPEKYPWATDLEHIGLAYRQHERLMTHWRETLDLEILDVSYEQVVAEPEAEIRRIIEFCGLPWNDACLAPHRAKRDVATLSYDQVRRPIYGSAVRRWEKYAAHLGPLERALGG